MTFSRLSPKAQFYLTLISALLACLLAYNIAIKQTLNHKQAVEENKKKLSIIKGASARILDLEDELRRLDAKTGINNANNDFRGRLLETVDRQCDSLNIVILNYPEPFNQTEQGYDILTYQFFFEGSFFDLQKLVYRMETQSKAGNIISVHYSIRRDFRKGVNRLNMKLYFQRILQQNNIN